ncbi:flagellar biosynthesis protein FlhF [Oceanobacillus halophilus]|uniref:Flagellar biosynthesis protein FlhF n=1 Tax=Oceanobacillus halophilus TaxID=930130 RepID=A0A495ABW7_9BACI|nr:flagellar biosynthesis protein FlhF [Oceanobacillus halophilus]RKQ37501.1 flagellar biosynthesis protein FlhF [Oceanobacillus halophilus]
MKIKKYIAPTMPEAMKQIRRELGSDAVILNSKQIQQGGFLGLFKKKKIEVVAALDPHPLPTKSEKISESSLTDGMKGKQKTNSQDDILKEIKQLKKLMEVQSNQSSNNYPVEVNLAYQQLLDQEVNQTIAKQIIQEILDAPIFNEESVSTNDILHKIKAQIAERLRDCSYEGINYKNKVIQFVGPTGVGKTTTIAKIASNCILNDKKNVAFITTDTYRIAAVEQLKTYARILNVPLEVVYTTSDYMKAIEKFQRYDLILVDTAGRNFREEKYVKDLLEGLDSNINIVTYLVLSLTSKPQDISEIYDQFHHVAIKEVIFTKIDETRQYGSILNTCLEKQVGIAYLTNGQDVPNDIVKATPEQIANLIVGDIVDE